MRESVQHYHNSTLTTKINIQCKVSSIDISKFHPRFFQNFLMLGVRLFYEISSNSIVVKSKRNMAICRDNQNLRYQLFLG